jgi:hypothetical protein
MIQAQKDYNEAFCTAEKYIKHAENESYCSSTYKDEGVLFAAINELRYAAFHAIQASEKENEGEQEISWNEAIKHCRRSAYDSLEAQFQFLLSECSCFQKDYGLVLIADIVKDYQKDCQTIARLKTLSSKRDGDHKNYWESMQCRVLELEEICSRWRVARMELNKLCQREQSERWYSTVKIVGVIVGAFAAVASIIIAILK